MAGLADYETKREYVQAKEIEQLRKLLKEALITLNHARVFIDSRQKMHNDGVTLYNEYFEKLQQALEEKDSEAILRNGIIKEGADKG